MSEFTQDAGVADAAGTAGAVSAVGAGAPLIAPGLLAGQLQAGCVVGDRLLAVDAMH